MRAYWLDASDVVRSVSGEWDSFARENGGAKAQAPSVIGRVIWDMIQGASTACFLDRMFYDVRSTQTAMGLLYRCDSPVVERLFHMRVEPVELSGIQVSHRLIRSRALTIVPLRALGHMHFRQCSQCLSCNFGGPWVEARHFRLPEGAIALDAVCPVCRAAAFLARSEASAHQPSLCG